jgi:hypothetical protein
MPKRLSKKRKHEGDADDPNVTAFRVVNEATTESDEKPEKNPAAVALGRLGGKKGGPARANKLSAERRSEIAKKAAEARWKQKD